jgi:hypothetical protein
MVAPYLEFTTTGIRSSCLFFRPFVAPYSRGNFRLKEFLLVVNYKYGATMSFYRGTKVAVVSLTTRINSQRKLAALRCENRKMCIQK